MLFTINIPAASVVMSFLSLLILFTFYLYFFLINFDNNFLFISHHRTPTFGFVDLYSWCWFLILLIFAFIFIIAFCLFSLSLSYAFIFPPESVHWMLSALIWSLSHRFKYFLISVIIFLSKH